jgi:hypothetical protein
MGEIQEEGRRKKEEGRRKKEEGIFFRADIPIALKTKKL